MHDVAVTLDQHQLVDADAPVLHTTPRSLRPRSTSMTCSARSLSLASSSPAIAWSAAASFPRGRVPASGRRRALPSVETHEKLGRCAEHRAAAVLPRRTCRATDCACGSGGRNRRASRRARTSSECPAAADRRRLRRSHVWLRRRARCTSLHPSKRRPCRARERPSGPRAARRAAARRSPRADAATASRSVSAPAKPIKVMPWVK